MLKIPNPKTQTQDCAQGLGCCCCSDPELHLEEQRDSSPSVGLGTPQAPRALGLTWLSGAETATQRKFHLLHRSGNCHLLPTPSHSLVHLKPVLSWLSSACLVPAHNSSSQAKRGQTGTPSQGEVDAEQASGC